MVTDLVAFEYDETKTQFHIAVAIRTTRDEPLQFFVFIDVVKSGGSAFPCLSTSVVFPSFTIENLDPLGSLTVNKFLNVLDSNNITTNIYTACISFWRLDGTDPVIGELYTEVAPQLEVNLDYQSSSTHILTTRINENSQGSGTVSPSGSTTYDDGVSVQLIATPNSGSVFVIWQCTGNIISNTPTFSLLMDRNYTCDALFAVERSTDRTLTINVINPEFGVTNPVEGSYIHPDGTTVTIVATPNPAITDGITTTVFTVVFVSGQTIPQDPRDGVLGTASAFTFDVVMDTGKDIIIEFLSNTLVDGDGDGGTQPPPGDTPGGSLFAFLNPPYSFAYLVVGIGGLGFDLFFRRRG